MEEEEVDRIRVMMNSVGAGCVKESVSLCLCLSPSRSPLRLRLRPPPLALWLWRPEPLSFGFRSAVPFMGTNEFREIRFKFLFIFVMIC